MPCQHKTVMYTDTLLSSVAIMTLLSYPDPPKMYADPWALFFEHLICYTYRSTLLENLSGDAIALLYVTKFLTISLYLTKLYVT